MITQSAWQEYVPKQTQVQASMMQQAARVPSRKISLTPDSPDSIVHVVDTNMKELGVIQMGDRHTILRGGNIGAIMVTLNGVTRRCDLNGLDWLKTSKDIGVAASMRGGEPVCTLRDLTQQNASPDILASARGGQCMYMSDQRGHSGLRC